MPSVQILEKVGASMLKIILVKKPESESEADEKRNLFRTLVHFHGGIARSSWCICSAHNKGWPCHTPQPSPETRQDVSK